MSLPLHYYAPAVLPCDHAPMIRGLQQRITALEAEKRALLEQLHRNEDLLARYRHTDEAIDIIRGQHRPRPTYLSASTDPEHQPVVIDECTGCAAGIRYPCAVIRALDPVEAS